jgi:hypothetical protein
MKKNLYIITYDLKNPGRNYENLLKAIKHAQTPWAMLGGSSYLVLSFETAAQIRDRLIKFLDVNDKIYVSLLAKEAAWYGLSNEVSNWILNNQK